MVCKEQLLKDAHLQVQVEVNSALLSLAQPWHARRIHAELAKAFELMLISPRQSVHARRNTSDIL
jgi:hypothetical protein